MASNAIDLASPGGWVELPFHWSWGGATDDAIPFRQIVDMLPQCIFWKDARGAFVGCNLAGARALGLPHPGDINGMVDADFHQDPMVASYLRIEDEKVMRGGLPIYRHLSQGSGPVESARWYETSKVPLRDAAGDVVGLLICYDDVTERERAEDLVRRANRHLDVAANCTHNWSMWVDAAGKVQWISPAAQAMCGYTLDECYVMPDYPLPVVHPDDRARLGELFAQVNGAEIETQFRFVRKDGELRWGVIVGQRVLDRHGLGNGIRASVIDITAQKAAEERLTALNASLASRIEEAAANAAAQERLLLQQSRYAGMGEMIDYIAHQWRQPLTALTLLLQNVQYDARDGLIDAAGLSHKIGRAFHIVDGMSSTIDDFRNFFRPVDADVEFDACACIDKVLRLMEPSLKHGRVEVAVSAAGPAPVTGRPNELAQVVLNLLTNAKDAVVAHRIDGRRIEIDVGSDGDRLTIRERNNGGCIPADQLGRIFGPYYTTKKDGTGLGLHMSRQIIDRHFGGAIACANTDDGVEFVMTLPLAAAS
jgi:PAS domain S-box-containing protein